MKHVAFALLVVSSAWAQEAQPLPSAVHQWTPAQIGEFKQLDPDARQDLIKLAKVGKPDAGEGPLVEAIPMAFFASAVIIVAIALYFARRRSQQLHETIRLCVEKGAPIPRELLVPPRKPRSDLQRGIVLVATGVGLSAFLSLVPGGRQGWAVGILLLAMGIGYIVASKLAPRENGT